MKSLSDFFSAVLARLVTAFSFFDISYLIGGGITYYIFQSDFVTKHFDLNKLIADSSQIDKVGIPSWFILVAKIYILGIITVFTGELLYKTLLVFIQGNKATLERYLTIKTYNAAEEGPNILYLRIIGVLILYPFIHFIIYSIVKGSCKLFNSGFHSPNIKYILLAVFSLVITIVAFNILIKENNNTQEEPSTTKLTSESWAQYREENNNDETRLHMDRYWVIRSHFYGILGAIYITINILNFSLLDYFLLRAIILAILIISYLGITRFEALQYDMLAGIVKYKKWRKINDGIY